MRRYRTNRRKIMLTPYQTLSYEVKDMGEQFL